MDSIQKAKFMEFISCLENLTLLKQTGYHHSNDRLVQYSGCGLLYNIRKLTVQNLYNLRKITKCQYLKMTLLFNLIQNVISHAFCNTSCLTMQNFLWTKLKFILHWILEKLDQLQDCCKAPLDKRCNFSHCKIEMVITCSDSYML